MSTYRYTSGYAKYPYRKDKGPNGRPLCRVCGEEVGPRRRTFCGDKCVETYLAVTGGSANLRAATLKRDCGVCALCGLDAARLERVYLLVIALARGRQHWDSQRNRWARFDRASQEWRDWAAKRRTAMESELRARGFDLHKSFWEADHIVPVVEGGGECGMDNIRTLCVPCHKAETAELRRRLAKPKAQQAHRSESRTDDAPQLALFGACK